MAKKRKRAPHRSFREILHELNVPIDRWNAVKRGREAESGQIGGKHVITAKMRKHIDPSRCRGSQSVNQNQNAQRVIRCALIIMKRLSVQQNLFAFEAMPQDLTPNDGVKKRDEHYQSGNFLSNHGRVISSQKKRPCHLPYFRYARSMVRSLTLLPLYWTSAYCDRTHESRAR